MNKNETKYIKMNENINKIRILKLKNEINV